MISSGQKMIIVIAVVSLGFAGYLVFPAMDITAQEQPEVFVTHSGAVVQTTGDILDPVYTIQEVEFDPEQYLRDFDYGEVSQLEDGTTLREFTIIAEDDKIMEIAPGIFYNVWTFNGQVPGPTIRATEGDLVRIYFTNNGDKEHTIHFHGNHPAEMDGIFEIVGSGGGQFTYEFIAGPVGVHPYHCHVMPVEEHIGHGLYGVFIVDPKEERPQADEMVMMLNGFDTDFDGENNLYAANTIPFYYHHHPIQINTNELIRVYVVNMVGLDPINNFHLHGTLYKYYPTGTSIIPAEFTDMTTFSQSERGILEFEYQDTGRYMFHAHLTEFSEKGWSGVFYVKDSSQSNIEGYAYGS